MATSNDAISNPENQNQSSFGNQRSHQSTMRQTVYQPISNVSVSRTNSQRNSPHHHSLILSKQHDKSTPQINNNHTNNNNNTNNNNHISPTPPSPVAAAAAALLPPNSFNNFSSSGGSFELVIQLRDVENKEQELNENFWDAADTHHMLPIFTSARAYVPSSFESLLIQSFFSVLTPLICEKLVCGQAGQTVFQYEVPREMVGRKFIELYRLLSHHHVRKKYMNILFSLIIIIIDCLFWIISCTINSTKSNSSICFY